MARRKNWNAEQIVAKLRQIEVQLAQGKSLALACKEAEIPEQKLQDECLKREIFYSLKEAQVVIGAWRDHYNRIRPHSSLGYRPPAPATLAVNARQLPTPTTMQ
jgi:transposase InsO family protein